MLWERYIVNLFVNYNQYLREREFPAQIAQICVYRTKHGPYYNLHTLTVAPVLKIFIL